MPGEIDCREGMVSAVRKGRYASLKECIENVVSIYIDALDRIRVERECALVFVHPVAPVIDCTRSIVLSFNAILQQRVQMHQHLHWLDLHNRYVVVVAVNDS